MNRRLTPWATHLAALAIGWSIYQFAPTDLKSTAAIASASRTRPDPRQAELAEGRRVLDEMRRFWPSPVKADVLAAARYDPVGFEADMRRQIAEELTEFRAMVVDPTLKGWSDSRFNLQPAIKP